MARLVWAVRLLEMSLPDLGAATEVGRDVMKSIMNLTKHTATGAASPGVERTALMELMQKQQQAAPLMALMQQQQAGGGAGAAAPAAVQPPVASGTPNPPM